MLRNLVRDVILVFGFTFLGGLVLGIGLGKAGLMSQRGMIALGVSNLLFMIVAYTIAGILTPTKRFEHLSIVAGICWVLSLGNMVIMPTFTLMQWLFALPVNFVCMSIGGGLSLLVRPQPPHNDPVA